MTALDFNPSVAPHTAGRTTPNARSNGIVTRTATEHVTEERVTVGTLDGTAIGSIVIGINVINIIFLRS